MLRHGLSKVERLFFGLIIVLEESVEVANAMAKLQASESAIGELRHRVQSSKGSASGPKATDSEIKVSEVNQDGMLGKPTIGEDGIGEHDGSNEKQDFDTLIEEPKIE
jgi:hypothetical protein